MGPKYPHVHVKMVGEDGNAFAIMGRVTVAMRRGGVDQNGIKEYRDQSTSGDYDHLLQTVFEWVTVDGNDDDEE